MTSRGASLTLARPRDVIDEAGMQLRRSGDRAMRILVAKSMPASSLSTEAGGSLAVERFTLDRSGSWVLIRQQSAEYPADLDAVLVPPGVLGERGLVVCGSEVWSVDAGDTSDPLRAAGPAILAWEIEHGKKREREIALERFVLFVERLTRETTVADVWTALAHHAAAIARGWTALCFTLRDDGRLHLHTPAMLDTRIEPLDAGALVRVFAPGLFTASSLNQDRELLPLDVLFRNRGVHSIGCISVGGRGLLVILERREQRVFEPDDWYRMRTIARQADVTIERLELRTGSSTTVR